MSEENLTAVFGGTFDPVHFGHMGLAGYLLENGLVARVVFLPAPHPPHKPGNEPAPFADRAAMIREITRVQEHTTMRDEILVYELGYRPDHPVPCAMWFAEVKIRMDRKPGEEPGLKLGWHEYKGRKRATMIY